MDLWQQPSQRDESPWAAQQETNEPSSSLYDYSRWLHENPNGGTVIATTNSTTSTTNGEDPPPPEAWEMPFTICILIVMFAVLVTDRIGTDSVMLTALTVFFLANIIDIDEALAGFSSKGLLTVLVLFVVAEGLNKTGALSWYVGKMLGTPRTPSEAQLRLLLPIAALSGFINDTPLVVMTLPIVIQWSKKVHVDTRYLLMPLSFAALLGGVCTVIGTSTNLVIVGLLQKAYPQEERFQNISLFAITQYGVPVVFVGLAYIIFMTPYLLVRPRHRNAMKKNHDSGAGEAEEFLLRARLTTWSPAVGRSIQRSGLRDTGGIYLVRVLRAATGNLHHAVPPEFVLQLGDVLYFTGLVEEFGDFCTEHGLEVVTNEIDSELNGTNHGTNAVVDIGESDKLLSPTHDGLYREDGDRAERDTKETQLLQFIGYSLDSVLGAPSAQRMRAIYKMEDSIRNNKAQTTSDDDNSVTSAALWPPGAAAADRVIVTATDDEAHNLVVIAIDTADRSGLLLDLSKCIARLHLDLHHTEAAVRHGRSLSIWRCESKKLNDDYLSEIWSVLHATLMVDKGAQAVKQRGQRVLRAQVCQGSRLAGHTPSELNFRDTYMAAIVAVQRDGKGVTPESSSLADFRFSEGDVVVLQVSDESPLLQSPPSSFYDGDETPTRPSGLAKRLRSLSQSMQTDNAATPEDAVADEAAALEANDGTKANLAVWTDLRVIQSETDAGASREFLTAVNVVGSSLVGKTAAEAGVERLPDLLLVSLERPVSIPNSGGDVATYSTIALTEALQLGDLLWYTGTSSSIGELRKIPGLVSSQAEEVEKIGGKIFDRRLVQAVVSRQGFLVGKTIKEVRFRTLYGAAVIAVHREGKRVHDHPGNVKLHAGDVLLLEAGPSFMSKKMSQDKAFALIAEVEGSAPPRMSMLIPALILTIGAYACYVAKLSDLIACAMVAAILMVIVGILSESEARDAIQWQIYLTIAAAFGIGDALVNSGLAERVAILLVRLGDSLGIGDAGLLGAVYLSTVLISQCVANNAAAALIFPIAMRAAVTSGIDRELMSLNIMLGASAAFMTPFGYQTNLMVMGPGGYTTSDFLMFGTPMQVVLLLTSVYALVSPLWMSWTIGFSILIVAAAVRVMNDRRQIKYKVS